MASRPNPEIEVKGLATPPVPLFISQRFMAKCACVGMRRGRGRLRARRKVGEYNYYYYQASTNCALFRC